MFKMLYDSNFTYDSSMPVYENKPPSWPYTLDYKLFHDCMIPPCPTRSYPGTMSRVLPPSSRPPPRAMELRLGSRGWPGLRWASRSPEVRGVLPTPSPQAYAGVNARLIPSPARRSVGGAHGDVDGPQRRTLLHG